MEVRACLRFLAARPASLPFTQGTFSSPLSLPAFLSRPQRGVTRKAFTPPAGWASFHDQEGTSQRPFFLAPNSITPPDNIPNSPPLSSFVNMANPPAADRYAALADLDSLFHQEPTTTAAPAPLSSSALQPPVSTWPASFAAGQQQQNNIFATASNNPFSGATNPTWTAQQQSFAANPFQAAPQQFAHFPLDNFPQGSQGSFVVPPNGAAYNGNVGFTWAPPQMGGWGQQPSSSFPTAKIAANPFMGSAVLAAPRGNSSNPFL